ncbi:ABC transporter substrate-binding protein [Actinoallomurus oryzae]|uniref:ABC transporter substrate-binding protein n=1 Tax=Actinoallomurus oryzae TaxID=502180 RepID=A0ABP8Q1Z6_9ACTN
MYGGRAARVLLAALCTGTMMAACAVPDDSAGGAKPQQSGQKAQTISEKPDAALIAKLPAQYPKGSAVRVGANEGSAPDEFRDSNGKLVGWEVDLVNAAAQVLDLRPDYHATSFDALIPGLQAKRYDLAIGQMGITPARVQVIDMLQTINGGQSFVSRSTDGDAYHTVADLCGKTVSTVRGAIEVDLANAQNPQCRKAGKKPIELRTFDQSSQAGLALTSGRVDVYWIGATAGNYFAQNSHGAAKVAGHNTSAEIPWGTAFPKGSTLIGVWRQAVQKLIDDGTYAKIMDKWGQSALMIRTAEINKTKSM